MVEVATLLARFGSVSFAFTLAVLVIVPVDLGVTTIVTLNTAATGNEPKSHIMVPPALPQVPCVGVAETKVTPGGRVSVMLIPVAAEGPPLVTVIK